MLVCRFRQGGREVFFCPTNETGRRGTDSPIIYIGVAETVLPVPQMRQPAGKGQPGGGGGFLYLKNECVIEARRENKMEVRDALKEITNRFKIPQTVIADYAGISRRTIKRFIEEETHSKDTEAKVLEGLRQISVELNTLCFEGEETEEEWED